MNRHSFLFAGLLLISGMPLWTQGPGRLPLRTFGVEQGMSSEVVSALVQDRQGLIWAGTEAGLHLFNGRTFEPFAAELPSQMVGDLFPDADGSLWVATQGGLARLKNRRTTFFGPRQGMPEGRVQSVVRDAQGSLWVLAAEGLYREKPSGGFEPAPALPTSGSPRLLFAHPKLSGPWVVEGRQIWRWDAAWKLLEAPPLDPAEALLGIAVDGSDQLWVRSSHNLWRRPATGTWRRCRGLLGSGYSVHARLERDSNGWVWFDDAKGYWRAKGEQQELIAPRAIVARGALVDREGGIWLRTQKGVTQVMGQMRWRSYGTAEGLSSATVWQTLRDPQGRLWVSTDEGLCVSQGSTWKRVLQGRILNLALGCEGSLWASGSPGGTVHQIDLRTLAVNSLRVDVLPVGRIVSGIAMDQEGRLWVADPQQGLARGQRVGTGWKCERMLWEGKEPREIKNMALDPEGRVLVAHQGGISVWHRGQWTQIKDVLKALPSNMAFGPQGDLLVSYLNCPQLSHYRMVDGTYRLFEVLDPFAKHPQIMIFSLGIEAKGRIWMGTSRGAAHFDPGHPESLRVFGMEEGMVSSDCGDDSLFLEADKVWIGTSQGLASYRTDLPEAPPAIQAPLLLSVQAGNNPLHTDAAPLVLPPGNLDLNLRFLIPSYHLPGRLVYQSRLTGVDPDWVNLEQPRIHYPSLHPGRYLLELRGRIDDGSTGPVLPVRFEILPRWWESRAAWACYLLLGAGAVYGLVRLRQAQLENRNRELREEVARQTMAVQLASQAKSAFLANMSHELRTPLNAILLYSELLQEDAHEHGLEGIQMDATKIQGAGRHLLGLIDDILDVSKIEAGQMRLHVEEMELRPFLVDLVSTLRPVVEKKGNRFRAELSQAPAQIRTDGVRLRQILSNLLSNAGKFTERGDVTLEVGTAGSEIVFAVHDTGIGMSGEELQRVFQEFVQADTGTTRKYGGTGLGLALVRRFAELLGGRVEARSEPGVGTTFTVRLPAEGPASS